MYILDIQNIFNFAVEATGRQNLFTVKSDVVTLYQEESCIMCNPGTSINPI